MFRIIMLNLTTLAVLAAWVPSVNAQKTKVGVDGRGDPLPTGAIARLGTSRWRIGESPLLFTSNGRQAITVGHRPGLLDVATGNLLRSYDFDMASGFLTPDDSTLIVAGKSVSFIELATGKLLRSWPIEGYRCSWSADGKRMASVRSDEKFQRTHTVWDLETGKALNSWQGQSGDFLLSPDGRTLLVRENKHFVLFDAVKGNEVRRWESRPAPSERTSDAKVHQFSPDGKVLASVEVDRVALWDPQTGALLSKQKLKPTLELPDALPRTVCFSRDGRLLAIGCNKGAYVWDLEANKLAHSFPDAGNGLPIYIVHLTPDAKTLLTHAHLYPAIRLWDLTTGKEVSPLDANARRIDAIQFSRDGKSIATVGPSDPVRLWDTESGKLLRGFASPSYTGMEFGGAVAFLTGGKSLAMNLANYLTLWELESGKVRYQPQGKLLEVGGNEPTQLYPHCSLDDNTMIAFFPGDVKEVRGGGRKPKFNVRWAMIGIWDFRSQKITRSFRVDAEHVRKVCLAPDGKTLLGDVDNQAHLLAWNIDKGVEMFRIPIPGLHGDAMTFSADGRTIFLSSWHPAVHDGRQVVLAYETASGKKRGAFEHHLPSSAGLLSVIASDRLMAISQNDRLRLVDTMTGKEYCQFTLDRSRVSCLAFSPNHQRLVSGNEHGSALVWDLTNIVPPLPAVKLSKEKLVAAWTELAGDDAEAAYRMIRLMSQAPEETVAFLKQQLKPDTSITQEQLNRFIDDLSSAKFSERDKASLELRKLGEAAEVALEQFLLKKGLQLETQRRGQELLKAIREAGPKGPWLLQGESLRQVRAVELLERIGTNEAKELLRNLATGAPHVPLTRQAQASVQRLDAR
jgi:WD40 repeat protein